MSTTHGRWFLLLAVSRLLLDPQAILAAGEWEPISVAGAGGSFNISVVYQEARPEATGGKRPYAFELEFGQADVDLRSQDDLFFVSAGARGYLSPVRAYFNSRSSQREEYGTKEDRCQKTDCDRLRLFLGGGIGTYFVDPDTELGWSLKAGLEFGWRDGKVYLPFEIGIAYHELESGFDFHDVTVGLRLHLRGRAD